MDGMLLALVAAARAGEGALIDHIESIDTKRLKLVTAMLTLRVIALTEPDHSLRSSARAVDRSIRGPSTPRPPA
jgi:hypothetical protein